MKYITVLGYISLIGVAALALAQGFGFLAFVVGFILGLNTAMDVHGRVTRRPA